MIEVKGESLLAVGETFGRMVRLYEESITPQQFEVQFARSRFSGHSLSRSFPRMQ